MFVSLRMGGGDGYGTGFKRGKVDWFQQRRSPGTRIVEAEGFSQRLAAAMLN
jgi:hypothetical protein